MSATPQISVRVQRTVAYESPDHLAPHGTKHDNSRNPWFNQRLYRLFNVARDCRSLKVLDIGCSGGGFVRDLLNDGHIAVGLEGSDYSKRMRRAEWATIPDYLFTGDITGDVDIFINTEIGEQRFICDLVTSWEVIEHIAEKDLSKFAENVKKHLAPDGIWIMSVANYDSIVDGINLHQTVQPKQWWLKKFQSLGLHHLEPIIRYFGNQFVRGSRRGETESEFHLALSTEPDKAPSPPSVSLHERLRDKWIRSAPQKALAQWITGQP